MPNQRNDGGFAYHDADELEFCWPELSARERAYRESVLRDVRERVRKDGPREAVAHPSRATQFMPFAALKGYHELAKLKEYVPEPRREITDEVALALSQTVASIERGCVVRVVHYENGGYTETIGAVSEVVEAHKMLRIVRKPIAFADIFSIEPL